MSALSQFSPAPTSGTSNTPVSFSSTLPPSALAATIATGVFFGIVVLSVLVYSINVLRRRWRASMLVRGTEVYDSYVVDEEMPRRRQRQSTAKLPLYSRYASPVVTPGDSSFNVSGRETPLDHYFESPRPAPLPFSLPTPSLSGGDALNSSSCTSSPFPSPGPSSALLPLVPLPPRPSRSSSPSRPRFSRSRFARYTMPPPTPIDAVTGLPLDINPQTPPPIYDGKMEQWQQEMLRQKRVTRAPKQMRIRK